VLNRFRRPAADVVVLAAVAGAIGAVTRALGSLRSRNWELQEELTAAVLRLERAAEMAAERDHELRNGLAGLAGITHLLGPGSGEPLEQAVLTELGRLLAMVDGRTGEPAADGAGYAVAQVLAARVALRDCAAGPGAGPIELRVEPGLQAAGDPDVLAQVVTNLLANCDRHAPGAPIVLRARARAGQVVVEVRDRGPGLSADVAGSVLDRGVRDRAGGGSGIGLHVSARALARTGGSLSIRTVYEPQGCLAEVRLPRAPASRLREPVGVKNRPPAV
jgi:two-component system OmpR family sensor kinase